MEGDEPARFTFAELFAGIGGFRVGLEAAGGKCVFACEYCKFAQSTYRSNWPSARPVGDIRAIHSAQIPRHDVLAAGFPCQSFSNAGRLGRLDDDRGALFHELVRIASQCRPKALLLENVRGLLTHAETLKAVLDELAAAGYPETAFCELDAASLVPQRRRRVYLVGFRDAAARAAFRWPTLPRLYRTADEILQHAIYSAGPPGLQLSDEKWSKVQSSAYYSKFPGSRLLPANALSQTLQATYKSGCLLYSQFVPQSSGSQPLQPPQPSQPPRFYSPREMARLMGFPESFALPTADGLAHRQLGNAVVPPLIGALGVAIAHALQGGGGARTIETCEALAVSLELTLASCDHAPRTCWLPCLACDALGTDVDDLRPSDDAQPQSDAASRVAGADYHTAPEEEEDVAEWVGPLSLVRVLEVARARFNSLNEGRQQHPQGEEPPQPQQTLPAPSSAIKAEVAAVCMRHYVMATACFES